MPELPEVETVKRGLERLIIGRKIDSLEVRVPKMIKTNIEDFQRDLVGQTFSSIKRRGKYLVLELDRQVLISHLRMEGKYLLFTGKVPENKHFHLLWHLDDGTTLVYQDVRKFGTFDLLEKEQVLGYFSKRKLGPEPTELTFVLSEFKSGLARSNKPIKTLLLDQTLVVGLGNIYVDEVLWASKIHPKRPASSISQAEAQLLLFQIIAILDLAIEKGGSTIRTYRNALGEDGSMQNYLQVYGKEGGACTRCKSPIKKIKVGGRGTHFCSECQK